MKRICVILFLCFPLLSGAVKGQEQITLTQCYEWAVPIIPRYGSSG